MFNHSIKIEVMFKKTQNTQNISIDLIQLNIIITT